jgi:hypothetical protein
MIEPLTFSSQVTIPDGVIHRDLQGELVLLNLNTGVYFGLDPLGTRIWHLLQESYPLQKVLDTLLREYEVPEARCREDLVNLITQMRQKGLIEVSNAKTS